MTCIAWPSVVRNRASQKHTPAHSTIKDATPQPNIWADTWLWEIINLIVSAVYLAALSIFLAVYNEKPIPQFYWGTTLNAVISTLFTTSKSALIAAIAPAIDQLKWHWFQSPSAASVRGPKKEISMERV
jgi:hypothetical protein